jgi:acetyl-CoA carboxylase carboxyltransferase component
MRRQAQLGGGEKRIEAQHAKGKLTARERLAKLLDVGTFQELGSFAVHDTTDFGMDEQQFLGDSVVTGFGKIAGRKVAVYAQDFTVIGGTLSEAHALKICRIMDLALESGTPIVGLNDSGGARIQEGPKSLAGYGEIFRRNTLASGVVPQISLILGPCAGGAVYSPALTDFTIMVRDKSYMFITGPEVIKTVTGEDLTFEALGGCMAHNAVSGVAHFAADDEAGALELARAILSYLPQNNAENPPYLLPADDPLRADLALDHIVPHEANLAYDMLDVIARVFDQHSFLEVHAYFARNAIVGFARLNGYPVGVVAQQPQHLAGVLDIDSSDKISRFVRFCDAFNLPVITLVDTPGYMPGLAQEHGGIIRHGAKVLYAYVEATVPKITLVTRKAIGGAYIAMGSKHLGADITMAWPTAEIAVMGPEGAVNIVYRKQIEDADDKAATRAVLVEQYKERFHTPYLAAARGYIDEVIEPSETRPRLVAALEILADKQTLHPPKKHGVMPV